MIQSSQTISPEELLYAIAEDQAGFFSTAQALEAGYSQRQLTYYVRKGRFIRAHRGVYRLALFPSQPNEDLYVAWLRTGPASVISHNSALALYELSDALPASIHVTIPPGASRRHPGLELHTKRLAPDDVTSVAGLPVTTIPRTIADVAQGGLADELVAQAISEAVRNGLVPAQTLKEYLVAKKGNAKRLATDLLGGKR